MDLSIVVILKNEEDSLPKLLQSIVNLELPVVFYDNGSTDKSVEIIKNWAKKYGNEVIVEQGPFHNFSFARNTAAALARTSWVLMLDADHEVNFTKVQLLETLEKAADEGLNSIKLRIHNKNAASRGYENFASGLYNKEELLWIGAVHEELVPKTSTGGVKERESALQLIHSGYEKADSLKEKALRNYTILQKELEESPGQKTLLDAGRSLIALEDYAGAKVLLERAVQLPGKLESAAFEHLIKLHLLQGQAQTARRLTNKLQKHTAAKAYAQWLLAQALSQEEKTTQALRIYENLGTAPPLVDSQGRFASLYQYYSSWALTLLLAGNRQDALKLLESHVKEHPDLQALLSDLKGL